MNKLVEAVVVILLVKLSAGLPDTSLASEADQNDRAIRSSKNGNSYPSSYNLVDKEGSSPNAYSFIEELKERKGAIRPATRNNRVKANRTGSELEKLLSKKKMNPKLNINKKSGKYINGHSPKSRLSKNCKEGIRCRENKNSEIGVERNRKPSSKTKNVPIRNHNVVNEESDEEEESTVENTKKNKIGPGIKKLALSVGNQLADKGLEFAANVAKDYVNKQMSLDADDDEELDDSSDGSSGFDDLINDNSSDADDENAIDDYVKPPTLSKKKRHLVKQQEPEEEEEDSEGMSQDNETREEADDNAEEEYGDGEDSGVDSDRSGEYSESEINDGEEDNSEGAEEQHEDQDEEEEEEDYTKKFKTPSGLEYLGSGYDLIRGNPLGDSITLLDPGYKSSVIQMHWNKNRENISNSLKFLQPVGGWIRPYSSCHKLESVTEIKSTGSFLKSLSADANVSFSLPGDSLKFAASANFKKLDDASKSGANKMFMNRSYCFKYVAGISTSLDWDFTLGFQSSLERLSEEFKGLEDKSSCKPYIYREDPNNENCEDLGVSEWMELFSTFGTHVTTKIYLGISPLSAGGKIFTTMEVKKTQEKKLSDQGMDVKAILSAQIKDAEIDSNVNVSVIRSKSSGEYLLDTKKSTLVLGGDIYGHGKTMDFGEWAKSVSDHPMPIKAEFTPISHFIDGRLRDAYNKAYLYYGKMVLENDFLRFQSQTGLTPEEIVGGGNSFRSAILRLSLRTAIAA